MLSFVVTDILFFYIYNLFYLSELTLSYIQETYRPSLCNLRLWVTPLRTLCGYERTSANNFSQTTRIKI